MYMNKAIFLIFAVLFMLPDFARAADNPVVIELFTSQSCASCPKADKVLGELATQDNVIALGCHVTYWDHLRWKDTLSLPACTERQKSYSKSRNARRIYTPQAMINGKNDFVGSHKKEVASALKFSGTLAPIHFETSYGGIVNISLPQMDTGRYELWVFEYSKNHVQDIGAGENRGKTVRYVNAVHVLKSLGPWDGNTKKLAYKIENREIDGIAVLAQSPNHGPVQAGGKFEF